jgi:RNA polymerase primary sigma factor
MSKAKVLKTGPESAPKKGKRSGAGLAVPLLESAAVLTNGSSTDISEKVKELVRLAQEQGQLTFSDISEALPDNESTPEKLDEIYSKLRALEIEIVDQAEVDNVKKPESEEEDTSRLDILDDPVRMYLNQMGQVALLTREQEVEISKRIEAAETEITKIIYGLGFAGKEHIALAEKLLAVPPRERFDRVILDKKVDSRDEHLRALRRAAGRVQKMDEQVDVKYTAWR